MYRLTLVKAWNTEELDNYATLVKKGRPDFIEVKVTIILNWSIYTTVVTIFRVSHTVGTLKLPTSRWLMFPGMKRLVLLINESFVTRCEMRGCYWLGIIITHLLVFVLIRS